MLDVLLEDIVVVLAVAVVLAPLISARAELLGEDCVVFSRAGGAPVVGEPPGGLVRQVVVAVVLIAGSLVSPLVN